MLQDQLPGIQSQSTALVCVRVGYLLPALPCPCPAFLALHLRPLASPGPSSPELVVSVGAAPRCGWRKKTSLDWEGG